MEISIRRVVLYRIFELLVISTVLSALCSAIDFLNIIQGATQTGFVVLVAAMVFFVATIVTMIPYYQDEEDGNIYLFANVTAYLIFAAVAIVMAYLANYFDLTVWYVWFFSVTTAVRFCLAEEMSMILAMLIFHGICIVPVFILPFVVRYINRKYRY